MIALVLGPMAEESLRQTLIISGGSLDIFLERGTSQVLLAAMVVMLALPLARKGIKRPRRPPRSRGSAGKRRAEEATNAEVDQDRERDQVGAP